MHQPLPATILVLAVCLAAVPAAAQSTSGGGGATTAAPPSARASPSARSSSSADGSTATRAAPSRPVVPPTEPRPSLGPLPPTDGSPATPPLTTDSRPGGGNSLFGAPPSSERRDPQPLSGGGVLQAEIQRCVAKHRGLDRNSDGELAADELEPIKWVLKDADRNHDEKIDLSELRSGCASGLLTDRDIRSSGAQ